MRDVEAANVERWRIEQFQRMGFTGSAAILLHEWQVDVRYAEELVKGRGCPPHIAMRILRPLEVTPPESSVVVTERVAAYSM